MPSFYQQSLQAHQNMSLFQYSIQAILADAQGAASAFSITNWMGRLVWNRHRYLKKLDTGKRVSRSNPESEWMIQDVPEPEIIGQDVWDAVNAPEKTR
jgi:hypothetical protein